MSDCFRQFMRNCGNVIRFIKDYFTCSYERPYEDTATEIYENSNCSSDDIQANYMELIAKDSNSSINSIDKTNINYETKNTIDNSLNKENENIDTTEEITEDIEEVDVETIENLTKSTKIYENIDNKNIDNNKTIETTEKVNMDNIDMNSSLKNWTIIDD